MKREKPSICLCMIVKNEAPVIRRCLDSVLPLIDHWVIVDAAYRWHQTSSCAHLAAARHPARRPWLDFAHNRSESLALARPMRTIL
jgi:hypothetical protein